MIITISMIVVSFFFSDNVRRHLCGQRTNISINVWIIIFNINTNCFPVYNHWPPFITRVLNIKYLFSLFCHDGWVILVSDFLKIYQCKSHIIGLYTDIALKQLTFENTDSEFHIVKLPDFFNETKVRDGSYTGIVIMKNLDNEHQKFIKNLCTYDDDQCNVQ